ncbi:MAG TPA: DUF2283 domain-containing protein [Chloroflexi bacterium]|nr:DUF2283 domain-containing protein [Chloroflexota bacterium]
MTINLAHAATAAAPQLLGLAKTRFWVDYDREADVLYINFQRPQKATNSVLTEDGVVLRYRAEELVGITVLDASTR